MKILEHVDHIKTQLKESGNYQCVADQSGTNYHWVQKFAIGSIKNPTVDNIAKLERYFEQKNNE